MFARLKPAKGRKYLQVVESKREGRKVRQRVVQSLGRVGEDVTLEDAKQIAYALLRFLDDPKAEELRPLETCEVSHHESRAYGNVAAVEDAWRSLGLDTILEDLAADRRYRFSLERAVFAMTANRLCEPKSKLGCAEWLAKDVYLPCGQIDSDQLYEALSWLESVKDDVELALYRRLRATRRLESTVVFFDTTTTWYEGRGPVDLAAFGRPHGSHPRGRRLILIALARSREGWPISHLVLPGNTNDIKAVRQMLRRLKDEFGLKTVIWVADRGTVSADVLETLESYGFEYVVATKLRGNAEVWKKVLSRQGRYHKVAENLEVKEVRVEERRYILCRNKQEIARDAARRRDILGRLEEKLAEGDRADTKHAAKLLASKSFGRYLKRSGNRLIVDRERVREDVRLDGKWVLLTNLENWEAEDVALLYKEEGGIEWDFRDIKTFYELRPLHHRKEERVEAHVFVCMLAKACEVELRRRMHAAEFKGTTIDAVLEELGRIKVAELELRSRPFWLPTRLTATQQDLKRILQLPDKLFPLRLEPYQPPIPRKVRLDNASMPEADDQV